MNKILATITFLASISICNAATIFVDQLASGNNNGNSWGDAYTSLQDALVASPIGTEIWVAKGTYTPDVGASVTLGDRNARFNMKNGVAIYGGFDGTETLLSQRDWENNPTILSGDIGVINTETDNTKVIIKFEDLDTTPVLDGFTITQAYNETTLGGALYIDNSSPTISNCIITNNKGKDGAAFLTSGGSPVFMNCTISTNHALPNGNAVAYTNANDTFINCKFINNTSNYASGGAILKLSGNSKAINCLFNNNTGFTSGAAFIAGGSFDFTNCTFTDNRSLNNSGSAIKGKEISIVNSILWGNSGGSPIVRDGGTISISHSIYQDNNENGVVDLPNGVTDGGNNTDLNPHLVDGYKIQYSQHGTALCTLPTVNRGTNSAPDLMGLLIDVDGNPRVQHTTVDIGAFESSNNDDLSFNFPDNIIYIDQNATGNRDGSSWANAYTNLQEPLFYIRNCGATADQIWVAKGEYIPDDYDFTYIHKTDLRIGFELPNMEIYGGFSGVEAMNYNLINRDMITNETILSGNVGDVNSDLDNSYTVALGNGLTNATLDGFTISDGIGQQATAEIAKGGGIKFLNSNGVKLNKILVTNNRANDGGGVRIWRSSVDISNSVINNNTTYGYGGGMYTYRSNIKLTNVSVQNNSALVGGGINNSISLLILENTTVSKNSAVSNDGGGIRNVGLNESTNKVMGYNSIIYDNSSEIFSSGATATFNNSMIKNQNPAGTGNIDATDAGFDPMFVDPANGDYRLQSGSPLINTGNNSYNSTTEDLDGLARVSGGTIDIGAFEFQQASVGAALDVSVSMFQVTFDYYLENLSSIDLNSLALIHDLDALFGAGNYSINSALSFVDDPSTINLNAGFNGSTDNGIIDTGSTLVGLDIAQIRLVVEVDTLINSGNYSTQVTVNAEDATMNMVADFSDFGAETDANSNNYANEKGENDATTFSIMTTPSVFSISFTPDAIVVNSSSTLTYTIDNSAGTTASNLAFSQTLPTGLVVADTANMINNCGGTFTANGTNISLSSGTVNAASTCTIILDITGTQGGTYNTTTVDLTSSAGNSGTANDTLTVDGAPVITAPANITTEATANLTPVDIGTATAIDLVDGMLMPTADNTDPYPVGETQVTWSVADSNGTIGSAIQTITITDTTAPIISLIGNATINLTVGDAYTDAGATASDLVDGDLSSSIVVTGSVDTNTVNTYLINFNVEDSVGNNATEVTRTVIVSEEPTYFVGGTVDGLFDGNFFVLKLNNDEEKIISQNGGYIFNTPLVEDDTYLVIMDLDPNNPIQPCALSNNSGTISTEDIMNVDVNCTVGDDLIYRNGFETVE